MDHVVFKIKDFLKLYLFFYYIIYFKKDIKVHEKNYSKRCFQIFWISDNLENIHDNIFFQEKDKVLITLINYVYLRI